MRLLRRSPPCFAADSKRAFLQAAPSSAIPTPAALSAAAGITCGSVSDHAPAATGNYNTEMALVSTQHTVFLPERPVVDFDRYAYRIFAAFGRALQIIEEAPMESSSSDTKTFREPQLSEVFVPQNVCKCEDTEVQDLESFHVQLSSLPQGLQLQSHIQRRQGLEHKWGGQTYTSISALLEDNGTRFAVVLGGPGCGKSSALRDYALRWATAKDSTLPLPILVELNAFAAYLKDGSGNLLQCVAGGGSAMCEMDQSALEARCTSLSSRTLLLLDGLDEIFDADVGALVMREIITLADRSSECVRIVITSRIIGYKPAELCKWGFNHFRCSHSLLHKSPASLKSGTRVPTLMPQL
jgi:hypothetical protein